MDGAHGACARGPAKKQVAKGKNPVLKRRGRRRRESQLRFASYVELFTEAYLKRRWKDWKERRSMIVRYAVPRLGKMNLSDIRCRDLDALYRTLDNKPSVAIALHAVLRKMFRWAMSQDDLKFSPAVGVERPRPLRPRSRYLSTAELSAAWHSSYALPKAHASMFRLPILTGQRRGELIGLRWSELDRKGAIWQLPAERAKNRRSHIIPLSPMVIAEIDGVAGSDIWPSEGLVFRSTRKTQLSGSSKIKREWDHHICRTLKLVGIADRNVGIMGEPWRLHDIRRTVATGMQALGIRTEITEAVLNHKSSTLAGLVGVYQCYDFQPEKRVALELWSEHVKEIVEKFDV